MLTRARFITHESRLLPGTRRIVPVPNPAAGADWTQTVPGGQTWRVELAAFLLTTSATVANRAADLNINISGALVYASDTSVVQAASIVNQQYGWAASETPGQNSGGTTNNGLTFPRVWLPPQATFGTITHNIQAADQYSKINLWVEILDLTEQDLAEILAGGEIAGEGWPYTTQQTGGQT